MRNIIIALVGAAFVAGCEGREWEGTDWETPQRGPDFAMRGGDVVPVPVIKPVSEEQLSREGVRIDDLDAIEAPEAGTIGVNGAEGTEPIGVEGTEGAEIEDEIEPGTAPTTSEPRHDSDFRTGPRHRPGVRVERGERSSGDRGGAERPR